MPHSLLLPHASLFADLALVGIAHEYPNARHGLANIASGHYGGKHWLAPFAVYMLRPV